MDRTEDEAAAGDLIQSWAAAVRRRDLEGIFKNHHADIVMFDVPPPFQSKGLEAYKTTWAMFFSWTEKPIPFEIAEMSITAGTDVAFAVASMRCAEPGPKGELVPLNFRLTVGLRKIDGSWMVTHEHHSVPATD